MQSPAQRFLLKHYAQIERSQEEKQATNAYELMLVKLRNDRFRLKKFESTEAKIDLKRQLIPEYMDWINGVLAAENKQQDDVFMNILIWMIDTRQFDLAYPLAKHALQHDWNSPDEYERKTATLITEELANTVLSQCRENVPVDEKTLFQFAELVANKDIFDQVRAKLHKALGYVLLEKDKAKSLENFKRALELDEKSGVKTIIDKLEKELKKINPDS